MDVLFGIDFGTTNSVISYFENNKVKIMMDGNFKTIPSKICKINDKYYCGNYIPINSTNIIMNFKNENNMELLIIFFKHLHSLIIRNFNMIHTEIKAVITVPSNFNDTQRETIKCAFETVGIMIIRMLNEPSAAALSYGLKSSNEGDKILVIDTGGGTMDFTILETHDSLFQVLYSEGLNTIGGNNFTQVIVDDINKKIKTISEYNVWQKAEYIKQKLALMDMINVKIEGNDYRMNRKTFNQLSNVLINIIEDTIKNIMNNNKFDYIIMVGGSSKLLLLQEIVKTTTMMNIWIHPNLDTVVAEGAGLYAGIIEEKFTENNDIVILDVVPLSLGVELADGTFSIIIPKNTPLPVKRTQKYTSDKIENLLIKVYQGERKIANKNLLIGEFNIDKVSCGTPILDITFRIDINSIINISVVDRKLGTEKMIILKNIQKLSDAKINELIHSATNSYELDNNELIKNQNIYQINTLIENATVQIHTNNLINDKEKTILLDRFNDIEMNINTYTNIMLLDIVNELENKCKLLINNNTNECNDNNDTDIIDIELLNNNKESLKNRIAILLNKNPEWKEYLEPVLEELSYNNITNNYIEEKLKLLNELEKEDKIDSKTECHNLCSYLKSEIENGNIKLAITDTIKLINLINANLDLLNCNEKVNWDEKITELNNLCESILFKQMRPC